MPVAGSGEKPVYEETQVVITKAKNSHNLVFLIYRFSSASCNRHLGEVQWSGRRCVSYRCPCRSPLSHLICSDLRASSPKPDPRRFLGEAFEDAADARGVDGDQGCAPCPAVPGRCTPNTTKSGALSLLYTSCYCRQPSRTQH